MKFLKHLLVILTVTIAMQSNQAYASANVANTLTKLKGLHESRNNKALRNIMGVNPRRIPWCGYAVAYALRRNGLTPPKGYPRALNWRKYGRPVKYSQAKKGDIVVIRTRWGHHVTVLHSKHGSRFAGIGGNQSNRLKISKYRVSSIVSVRTHNKKVSKKVGKKSKKRLKKHYTTTTNAFQRR